VATYNITLKEQAVTRLQQLVARYNGDNGATLTVEEWVTLHLKELAVQDDLLRAAEDLRRQADDTARAALEAERKRLLDSVS
jgi:hypothetical protein